MIVLEVKCSNLETAFHLLKKNCCDKSRQRVNVKNTLPLPKTKTHTHLRKHAYMFTGEPAAVKSAHSRYTF